MLIMEKKEIPMTIIHGIQINPDLDLLFEREIDVPTELVWAAWTQPEHLKKWFTPAPWKTVDCEIELKAGGIFRTVMLSPEGQEMNNVGCYLEIIENRKLVFTDTLLPGFRPSENPFFTAIVIFEPTKLGTKYVAIARHGKAETCKQHKDMGFFEGWGAALDQLVTLTKTMK